MKKKTLWFLIWNVYSHTHSIIRISVVCVICINAICAVNQTNWVSNSSQGSRNVIRSPYQSWSHELARKMTHHYTLKKMLMAGSSIHWHFYSHQSHCPSSTHNQLCRLQNTVLAACTADGTMLKPTVVAKGRPLHVKLTLPSFLLDLCSCNIQNQDWRHQSLSTNGSTRFWCRTPVIEVVVDQYFIQLI